MPGNPITRVGRGARAILMGHRSQGFAIVVAEILVGAVAGCATVGSCGFGGCPDDAGLTATVWATLKPHPAAQPPNLIHVQTLNHVVFLRGQVDTDAERLSLEEAARGVAGVKCVEDLINLSYQGH